MLHPDNINGAVTHWLDQIYIMLHADYINGAVTHRLGQIQYVTC